MEAGNFPVIVDSNLWKLLMNDEDIYLKPEHGMNQIRMDDNDQGD